MQTVATTPNSPVNVSAPATVRVGESGPVAPFLDGTYAESLGRARGHPALPDDEWDDNATDEEHFAALKAAVEEGFRAFDEGRYIEIPAGGFGDFIDKREAGVLRRLRAKSSEVAMMQ